MVWSWLWEWYCALTPQSPVAHSVGSSGRLGWQHSGHCPSLWPGWGGSQLTAHGSRPALDIDWSQAPHSSLHYTHFPIIPPSSSHTQTASRLESHHQSPDLVITTFIFLLKYLQDSENVGLGMWCTVRAGVTVSAEGEIMIDLTTGPYCLPCHDVGCQAILRDIWTPRHLQCSHIMPWHLCHMLQVSYFPVTCLFLVSVYPPRTLLWYLKRLLSPLSLWWPLLKSFGFRIQDCSNTQILGPQLEFNDRVKKCLHSHTERRDKQPRAGAVIKYLSLSGISIKYQGK